ncbi:uncharacterized protein BP5553_08127 [Venustampulla echinocandica]|uniref:Uncharacterized protein n=1 Tax=Venustampulla echinocandica TaxID=2656787 RepID=A0A370TFT2_9HELO|nr:uncharacterized protein BP5553_08127 [Venustampulla echinocandica]RDL33759.1 hypothetical protein BP5553_08127 [Venustampulla echinocandica]
MSPPILFNPAQHAHLFPSLVLVHKTCITSAPYTIATFLPPLQEDLMASWWQDRIDEVSAGTRQIIMQMAPNQTTGAEELAGKMGFARAMMEKLEEVAKSAGRGLLMLDTEVGSPAEVAYPRLGYIDVSFVPPAV